MMGILAWPKGRKVPILHRHHRFSITQPPCTWSHPQKSCRELECVTAANALPITFRSFTFKHPLLHFKSLIFFQRSQWGIAMNKWMLSAAGAVMMVCAGVSQAEISDDPATVSDQIFRAGVAYCNSAVKVSRSDSRQARSDINQYQAHVGRAQSIYPALLDQNDYARREHQRCSQIGENIARAEALPVIEKGLA